jgi:hypothetical protein
MPFSKREINNAFEPKYRPLQVIITGLGSMNLSIPKH